jgi:hypothetical protein
MSRDVIDGRPPYWRYFFRAARDVLMDNNVRKRTKIGHLSGPIETFNLIKPGLRHQDFEGIHLPSFRFSWKLKKLCRADVFVLESWQTAEDLMALPCDFNEVCHD